MPATEVPAATLETPDTFIKSVICPEPGPRQHGRIHLRPIRRANISRENLIDLRIRYLTMGQKRAILAEVLTVTVLPTKGGGRAPDGSYFHQDAIRIELTELAERARLSLSN